MTTFQLVLLLCAFCDATQAISVINIRPLLANDGDDHQEAFHNCTRHVDEALSRDGIFLAQGWDGIGPRGIERVDEVLDAARNLFAMPDKAKEEAEMTSGEVRGFIRFAKESGLLQTVVEPKEGFSYGKDWPAADNNANNAAFTPNNLKRPARPSKMHAPNKFPVSLALEDRVHIEYCCSAMARVSAGITRAIHAAIAPSTLLDGMQPGGEDISLMRLFHYFSALDVRIPEPAPGEVPKEVLGSAPHTDWGFLTLILGDGPGLQFFPRSSSSNTNALSRNVSWIDVPHIPNTLIINAGDYLALSLRGRYVSPIHRVVSPQGGSERYSYVYFAYPGFDSRVPQAPVEVAVADSGEEMSVGLGLGEEMSVVFNTLLSSGSAPHYENFADYVFAKWRGVYSNY